MDKQKAIKEIVVKVQALSGEKVNENPLTFYVEKLVTDMLAYCHREDFPEELVYTAVELILKRLQDDRNNETGTSVRGPLSSIKMDDTEYHFAVSNVSASGLLSDLDFDSIKPKLNLYRRVVSHA